MSESTSRPERVRDPGVRALFSRQAQWQSWLDCEAELAAAEAGLGIIPSWAAEEIRRKARLELLDSSAIEERQRLVGHGLVALIWEFDRICENGAGAYLHWGATTQNITQTALLRQVRTAHSIFLGQLRRILTALAALAEQSKEYAIAGRTHGQHAVPATFGLKVASWIDELCRHVERLRACEGRVFVAMLGGAAGTFASFGEQGPALQATYAARLGMAPMPVPFRNTTDHLAEYVCLLAMLASTAARIAFEVYNLMKEEYGEASEPVTPGTVGSSTMPQKHNPSLSQAIITAEAALRAQVPLALQGMQGEHEAANAWLNMSNRALTEACVLTGDILERLALLAEGMRLDRQRMRRNLDLSGGLIMAEAIMLELGRHLGRQRAHDAVHAAAEEALHGDERFVEVLRRHPEISSALSGADFGRLLDPERYTGLCSRLAEEQAARAREVASSLPALS